MGLDGLWLRRITLKNFSLITLAIVVRANSKTQVRQSHCPLLPLTSRLAWHCRSPVSPTLALATLPQLFFFSCIPMNPCSWVPLLEVSFGSLKMNELNRPLCL